MQSYENKLPCYWQNTFAIHTTRICSILKAKHLNPILPKFSFFLFSSSNKALLKCHHPIKTYLDKAKFPSTRACRDDEVV